MENKHHVLEQYVVFIHLLGAVMTKYAERIAVVETKVETIDKRTASIEEKVDILVAHHNKQKGQASILAMVWAGVGGLVATFAGWLLSKF